MRFEKVSYNEWKKAIQKFFPFVDEKDIEMSYANITLPVAGTSFAAGHDFFFPFTEMEVVPEENGLVIPTGIRWVTDEGEDNHVLMICPRSGLGTKFGMRLKNTVGVIDSDYCGADNEGHIMANIVCDSKFTLKCGDRFMQGIIVPFVRCGDNSFNNRKGGFGSTGN